MSHVKRLLAALGRDQASENELAAFIHDAILPAVRQIAGKWHAPDRAEEAEQEFWVWLLEHHMQPLRKAVEGHDDDEVQGLLYVVAARFANRWFRKESTKRRRENEAVAGHAPEPPGPTEAEVRALTAEFERLLTPAQREALHELLWDERPESGGEGETPESRGVSGKWRLHKEIQRLYWKLRDFLWE